MATCLLLTVRAANFLSLMSRKHAWNRCLIYIWSGSGLHCNHSPRPPNREPGSMRKKEKKRRGRRRWDTRDMLTGTMILWTPRSTWMNQYSATPDPDIGGDRRQIRSPRTLYSAGTPALDGRLLSSPRGLSFKIQVFFPSPSRGNSK